MEASRLSATPARALLALLLLAPLVQAATPVAGEASFSSDALLEGPARVEASEGALDLSGPLARGGTLALSWGAARGHLVSTDWTVAFDPLGTDYNVEDRVDDKPLDLAAATLVGLDCAGTCQLLVLAERGGGALALSGEARGAFRWLAEPRAYWSQWQRERTFLREYGAGTLLAGGPGLPLAGARAEAHGRLGLFFQNATLVMQTEDGAHVRLDATTRRETVARLPGGARVDDVVGRFAFLELEDAQVAMGPDEETQLLAPRLRVALDGGALRADRAEGRVVSGGREVVLSGDPLDVEGVLALDAAAPRGRASVGLLDQPRLHATFQGDATRVRAGAVRVEDAAPAFASPEAGAAVGLALLATLPWWLPRLLVAPLYSRIRRGSVLENENRARLHRLIGDAPGLTPACLARRLGLARVVVRHHLRMLESHRLVACRMDGRKRRYVLPDAGPAADAALLALLRDGPRRKVAEALAASPVPLTQQQIAALTGYSPRLVSYHLARLADLGVLHREGARPSAYGLKTPLPAGPGERPDPCGASG